MSQNARNKRLREFQITNFPGGVGWWEEKHAPEPLIRATLALQQATLSTAYSVHIIHLLHFLMTTWDSFTEISAIADRYMKWPENTKAAGGCLWLALRSSPWTSHILSRIIACFRRSVGKTKWYSKRRDGSSGAKKRGGLGRAVRLGSSLPRFSTLPLQLCRLISRFVLFSERREHARGITIERTSYRKLSFNKLTPWLMQ